jgi:hypothetical protein
MKSRRRIAFTKAGTTPNRTRLQQGFVIGEMGADHHFAWQQFIGPNVRFGSKADIARDQLNVRFTPKKRTLIERVVMSALCQKRTFTGTWFDLGRREVKVPL